jgi:hypothetical protein
MSDPTGYFVMILFPFGPKPMVNDIENPEDPKVCLFETKHEARRIARTSRAVAAYGAEIYHLGSGEFV